MMDAVASGDVLAEAYDWLCQRRREAPFWHEVWDLRWRWDDLKPRLQAELLGGTFRLGATRPVHLDDGTVEAWASRDALVLKAVAIVLGRFLPPRLADGCFNWKGEGGLKGAVRAVRKALPDHDFVYRSDVRKYYASLDPEVVYRAVERHVADRRLLDLLWRYLHRSICDGGEYRDVHRGIPRGCPLSPLLGALCLADLEAEMGRLGLFFARFMDDWVVLATTRWKLRRAVRRIREIIAGLGMELAPEKTFEGRVARGFDFLGYRFGPEGVRVAEGTVGRFVERASRLYEQGAEVDRIGEYVRRWVGWVRGGLGLGVGVVGGGVDGWVGEAERGNVGIQHDDSWQCSSYAVLGA
ncbi:MAG: hypothetical protein GY835_09490 [bacterium]|nr:hypothetical protein [bacterium]